MNFVSPEKWEPCYGRKRHHKNITLLLNNTWGLKSSGRKFDVLLYYRAKEYELSVPGFEGTFGSYC